MQRLFDGLAFLCSLGLVANIATGFTIKSLYWKNIIHLFSFGVLLGIHAYTLFVVGFVMIRAIPRHMFGQAQSKLFPAFHAISVALICLVLTILQMKAGPSANIATDTQLLTFAVCLGLTLLNYLHLSPRSTEIMWKLYMFEREAGVGQEMALKPPPNEELDMNKEYKALRRSFGKFHGIAALCTLITFAGLLYHLHYLSSKLRS